MSSTTAAAPARRLENLGQVVGTSWPDGRHLALVGPAGAVAATAAPVAPPVATLVAAPAGRAGSAPAAHPEGAGSTRPVLVRRGGITRRGRWVLTVLGAVLLACVFVLGRSTTSSAAETAPAPTTVVVPGQTLWSIATQLAPDADPRRTVHALQTLNHLAPGDALVPGQVLLVPRH